MLNVLIQNQPDGESCGPTSLHAVYQFYDDRVSLDQVIHEVERVVTGGTISAFLGQHALTRGYRASIYVYDLSLFDLTWFKHPDCSNEFLSMKLKEQLKYKHSKRFEEATKAYLDFMAMGGKILYHDLSVAWLREFFELGLPLITGLSSTYLYNCPRERAIGNQMIYDDLRGTPCGHFVVLCGYDEQKRHIVVADPHRQNPISQNNYYKVKAQRLINSIMLGVLTYDANLLMIEPISR
ncbi:MAG: peptidase-C39 like family protein [Gammaproteobacteria bacterium]|nr:peptidase-C39 like family protein [Gammaproteobacteria bacterium]